MAKILQNAQKRAIIDTDDKYVFNHMYFGTEGMTSTSAQHVSAMAQALANDIRMHIKGLRLYEKSIRVIGEDETTVEMVNNTLPDIPDAVKRISKANALTAWLREAVKERQAAIDAVANMSLETWMEAHGRTIPEAPSLPKTPTVNFNDLDTVLGTGLTLKEYNRYLELNSTLSVYGEMIHDGGLLTTHKQELIRRQLNPTEVKESGRDTIITTYHLIATAIGEINEVYVELQKEYRKLQAEKNGIDSKFQALAADYQTRLLDEHRNQMARYRKEMEVWAAEKKELELEMAAWKKCEMDRIVALKIIIPNDLLGIYTELQERYL